MRGHPINIRSNPGNAPKESFEKYAKKMQYVECCVNSDYISINRMRDVAQAITFETFRKRVSITEVSKMLGYGRNFSLKNDWHVAYYRSHYKGQPCYYLVHSAIEYIFV